MLDLRISSSAKSYRPKNTPNFVSLDWRVGVGIGEPSNYTDLLTHRRLRNSYFSVDRPNRPILFKMRAQLIHGGRKNDVARRLRQGEVELATCNRLLQPVATKTRRNYCPMPRLSLT
jgi:hypothetical protein